MIIYILNHNIFLNTRSFTMIFLVNPSTNKNTLRYNNKYAFKKNKVRKTKQRKNKPVPKYNTIIEM